jgi:hypothetical protein
MPLSNGNDPIDEVEHAAFDGQLCQHAERPHWGLAVRIWTRRDLRGYQFEDGKLRVIADKFEHFMHPVNRPIPEAERLREELWKLSGLSQARIERRRGGRKQSARVVSFDEQVALFLGDYPGGFSDPAWLQEARGIGTGRKTTRHRDPAIERARSLLSAEELAPLIRDENHYEIIARAQQALEGCSLVSTSQAALLSSVHPSKQRAFAFALHDWLHGDDPPARHFDRLVTNLEGPKRTPSWPLVTAFAALVDPDNHVCVKPSVVQQQAKVLAPNLVLQRRPSHGEYELVRGLAQSITEELNARELVPKDRLDIHDFIWATIRPAAVTRIESLRAAATESPEV